VKDFTNLLPLGDIVKKEELAALVNEYGDAIITYRSENSKKLKYNVCTMDFSTPYIQDKKNRAKETDETLLLFCWDTDSYRLLNPESVTSVLPLSSILQNQGV
jgi:hypothetical protein